jgi:hypothetical protein
MDTGASQPIRILLGFIYSFIFASMLASSGEEQELNSSVTSCDKARRGGKIH